jgi:hypothetical protein
MERPTRQIPPIFQDLPGDDAPNRERNVLEEVPDKLIPLERQTYEVAEELRLLMIWAIILAAVTTWVFPVLPDTVTVGGWALWWLGGAITTVMEFVAQYWLIEVVLGGLFLLSAFYLVIASHWLRQAPLKMQWCMYGSVVVVIPNVLALLAIVVLWLAVVFIWVFLIFLFFALIGGCIELCSSGR